MCINKSVVDECSELEKTEHFFLFNFKYNFEGLDSALQAEVHEKGSQYYPN